MVYACVVLCDVVGFVGWAGSPVVSELSLGSMAAEPVESHVHQFEALAGNVVCNDAKCSGVVCLNGRRRLLAAHGLVGI